MITAARKDHSITRNSCFFKKVCESTATYHCDTSDDDYDSTTIVPPAEPANENDEINDDMNDSDDVSSEEETNDRPMPRRSTRETGQLVRYPMDVRT